MARTTELLTAIKVKNAKAKGLYPDGAGLYLKVTDTGSKSWVYRYKRNGKARDMGLGNADVDKRGSVTLAQARKLAGDSRQKLLDGIDPLDEKKADKIVKQEANEGEKVEAVVTFRRFAEEYIRTHQGSWRNQKHRDQWRSTLAQYAYPHIGSLPPAEITVTNILEVLKQPVPVLKGRQATKARAPLWDARAETATRLRARIEAVLSAAKPAELLSGENPAAWEDNLQHLLPAKPKSKRVVHRSALPYNHIPALMEELRGNTSISARALELCILCANRPGEVLGAEFTEFDLDAAVWSIPAKRMKAHKLHKIPLVPRAVEIVKDMAEIQISDYVFPGVKSKRPLSDMALTELLRGMRAGYTVHGTARSGFKVWATEKTVFPDPISEVTLAHVNPMPHMPSSLRLAADI